MPSASCGLPPLHFHSFYDPTATIGGLFLSQVEHRPEKIAVVDGDDHRTYRQLAALVALIASDLVRAGVPQGARVAILAPRGIELVAAQLAILAAGAAFVALDPGHPSDHHRSIVAEARPAAILAHSGEMLRAQELGAEGRPVIALRSAADGGGAPELRAVLSDPQRQVGPDDLAYVIYTSGSTGRPKGVMVPHRGVCRLVRGQDYADLGPEQVLLHMAAVAFDASIIEIYSALLNGGTLAILPDAAPSLDRIRDVIADNGVTTAFITAGLFHLIAEHCPEALGQLSQVIPCGDVLSEAHVRKVLELHPRLRVINGYGPAENTVGTCFHTIDRQRWAGGPIPIGSALNHDHLFILDEENRPLGRGEIGQLAVGGAGLALGYLGRPDLTAERFIDANFEGDANFDGFRGRIYLTGDLALMDADGVLHFHGRADRQVKIAGQRVELDAVEHALRADPEVEDAVAVAVRGLDGARRIVAVVKARTEDADGLADQVLARMRATAPAATVPSRIIVRGALPLSNSGKVDRRLILTELEAPPQHAPALMEMIRQTWLEVLELETLRADRTFFELGGTSMQLIAVHALLQKRLGRSFDIAILFEAPRLRELEQRLGKPEGRSEADDDPVARRRVAMARARNGKATVK